MEPTLATRRRGRAREEAPREESEGTINLDDPLVQRVQAMSRRVAERSRDRAEAAESAAATIDVETGAEKVSHVASDDALIDAFVGSAPVEQRLQRIERRLAKSEQDGLFLAVPMRPVSEFPSIMARLPVFMPTRRQRQKLMPIHELLQALDRTSRVDFLVSLGLQAAITGHAAKHADRRRCDGR